jgi:phosphatidylglycerol---prolipoprotein diacylglyceryl transferase
MATFPVMLEFGDIAIHPHLFFDVAATFVGFQLFLLLRRDRGDAMPSVQRGWLVAAAFVGALVGARLLAVLQEPQAPAGPGVLAAAFGGKTIVGALIGGHVAVEFAKKRMGITQRTGDLYVIPLCIAIALGRIGCLLSGLEDRTYGTATDLPWGIDFGDGIARHPTAFYEIVFLLLLVPVLWAMWPRLRQGTLWRIFLASYLGWRLLVDFIKPAPLVIGLSAIQWAALLSLGTLAWAARPRPLAEASHA